MSTQKNTQAKRLLVFADDWGRHPSSCQHLVRRLMRSWNVTWVNTIGTRSPGLNMQTVRRGWEKLTEWRATERSQPDDEPGQLRVLSPRMWPRFTTAIERKLNQRILSQFLRRQQPGMEETVCLTTLPIVADLVGGRPVEKWVYYCVDDFASWPGLDAGPLRFMENQLIGRVDHVVAAGENLADRVRSRAKNLSVVSHGVDLEFWSNGQSLSNEVPWLKNLERPLVVFWGLIDRRLHLSTLQELGAQMKRGTIVLVGPEQEPDPLLDNVPRLVRVGPCAYAKLPAIAAAANALIMPYADMPVTRAMQPLKLKEYLATFKPVITTSLPAIGAWKECLDVADEPRSFVAAVMARLESGLPTSQRVSRQTRLERESWEEKSKQLESVLLERFVPKTTSVR